MYQTNVEVCRLRVFDFSDPTENLMNVDNSLDTLYPGSFVQAKYISTGAESLVKLPISHQERHPIRLGGKGNFPPTDTASS